MKAIISSRSILSRIVNLCTGKVLGTGASIKDVPIPNVADNGILVKVNSVALNPIDFKYIDLLSPPGSIIGCDYAGHVIEVGKSGLGRWKIGDRVAGIVHGGISGTQGSFAEYLVVDAELAWRIPDGVSDDEAATYGTSAVTAMLALNVHLNLPWFDDVTQKDPGSRGPTKKPTILIYAGSTSVGLFALQLARKSGYRVITTASPHSFDLVRSYGADEVFDYRSKEAVQQIRAAYPDITLAMDCISEGPSSKFCAEVLKGNGGKVVTLLDNGKGIGDVELDFIVVFTTFNEAFSWLPPIGPKFPVREGDRHALARFYAGLPSLLSELKAPPVRVMDGRGLEAVFGGLDELRHGRVSGKKLVVRI